MTRKLIANRWKCPDGVILQSKHRRDFVEHGEYLVDGGLDYIRAGWPEGQEMQDLCVYSDDPHEAKRDAFYWGSYGRDGKGPIQWILLKDMTEEHIWNIIRDMGDNMKDHILEMFKYELKYRKEVENAN